MSKSDDRIAQINTETARRKAVWEEFEAIAREVVTALRGEYQRRGISFDDIVKAQTHEARKQWGGDERQITDGVDIRLTLETTVLRLRINLRGGIHRYNTGADLAHDIGAHGGYLNLSNGAPDAFREALILALMANIQ